MGSHPERDTVLRWAEQCRAKAKTMRFRSLAYLAMWATPEPTADLAGREMQGRRDRSLCHHEAGLGALALCALEGLARAPRP
jgi:hypothetical protein